MRKLFFLLITPLVMASQGHADEDNCRIYGKISDGSIKLIQDFGRWREGLESQRLCSIACERKEALLYTESTTQNRPWIRNWTIMCKFGPHWLYQKVTRRVSTIATQRCDGYSVYENKYAVKLSHPYMFNSSGVPRSVLLGSKKLLSCAKGASSAYTKSTNLYSGKMYY